MPYCKGDNPSLNPKPSEAIHVLLNIHLGHISTVQLKQSED